MSADGKTKPGEGSPQVTLALPHGAMGGSGDRWRYAVASGAAAFSLPIPVSSARGTAPVLTIETSAGNGPFGFGLALILQRVSRRTDLHVPRYNESDQFSIDANPLTPLLARVDGRPTGRIEENLGVKWQVDAFQHRVQTTIGIERWSDPSSSDVFWKTISAIGDVSYFGRTADSRIADPDAPERIADWLLDETCDTRGNRVVYRYRTEDSVGVPPGPALAGHDFRAGRHLDRIDYGNWGPADDERFALSVLFDYGDYDAESLAPAPVTPWPARPDCVSSYRRGFEVRDARLCRRILMTHTFPEVNSGNPVTVAAVSFEYDSAAGDADAKMSVLRKVRALTSRMDGSGHYDIQFAPVRTITWSAWRPSQSGFSPLALDGQSALWTGGLELIDLKGEGAPGLLTTEGDVVWYRAPLETGYQPVVALRRPAGGGATAELSQRLEDLTGSGRLDVVTLDSGRAGYAPAAEDGWGSFAPFAQTPPGDLAARATSVGMTGSGLPDLALWEDEVVRLYPSQGRAGFAAPLTAELPADFPASDDDEAVLIAFADMFGDGLPHRVRIGGGEARIWPCLGNGRYGPSVTMAAAPDLGGIPSYRARLVDVTGSGLADLVLIGEDRIDVYLNQAGAAFAPPVSVTPPFRIDAVAQIGFADISSSGVPSLVLTAFAPSHETRAFDFCAGAKPYQLTGFDNGVGQSHTFVYRSARDYYLRAKSGAGGAPIDPWVTRLAAPPQVLASVETADTLSGTLRRESFEYRNGCYDAVERRFVGFSQVDHVDVTALAPTGWQFPDASPPPPAVAASLTRSWYDLGVASEAAAVRADFEAHRWNGDPLALELPASVFAPEILAADAETQRQAAFTLSGRAIRTETFEIDPSGKVAEAPLTVSQGNLRVTLVQARTDVSDAIFLVTDRESADAVYEGVADDPRVEHDVTLAWDKQGAVTLSAQVAYPRRPAYVEPGLWGQNTLVATAALHTYAGDTVVPLALCWEAKLVELGGLPTPPAHAPYFAYDTLLQLTGQATAADRLAPYGAPLPADGRPCSRQLKWSRTAFWDAHRQTSAPLGTAVVPVLVHHHETAVLSDGVVADIYQERVSPACLSDCAYVAAKGYWWTWSDIVVPSDPAAHFMPVSATNAFGKTTSYTYDPYAFMVTSLTDPAGNLSVAEIDYQALVSWRVTDPNGVVAEAILGPDRRPIVETVWKSDGRGGVIGNAPVDAYRPVAQVDVAAVLAAPETFLQGAETFTYTQNQADPPGAPRCSVSVRRTAWVKMPGAAADGPIEVDVSYFDGAGRTMAKASRVMGDYTTSEHRPPDVSETDWMWVLSGRRDLDAKEQPLRLYAPSFASAPDWSLPAAGLPFELYQYDGVGRVVLSASPSGWTSTIARSAWSEISSDRNATDRDSPFFGLATTTNLDVLGRSIGTSRPYLEPGSSTPPRPLISYVWRDVEGRVTAQADARFYSPEDASGGLRNFTTAYGMTNQPLAEGSVDMAQQGLGLATTFFDALGAVVIGWDNKGRRCVTEYDADLRRPIAQYLKDDTGERVIARMAYGLDPATKSIGRQVQVWDQSGRIDVQTFDLLGQPATFTRCYRTAYDTPTDWTDTGSVPMEPEVWPRAVHRGVTGATERSVEADGSTVQFTRNPGGSPRTVTATWSDGGGADVVTSTAYDSFGHALRRALANGAINAWTYDPLEARLVETSVTRDGERVMAAAFQHDRVGNAVSTTNLVSPPTASPTPPQRTYAYDSMYRLVSTTGLEQASMTGRHLAESAAPAPGRLQAARADPSQLAPYTRMFTYDDGDNLTRIRHIASDSTRSWTRDFAVSPTSNHAVPAELVAPGGDPDTFFDATGNLQRLDDPWGLQYDEADRLLCAVAVSRQDSAPDASWYLHDMMRHRARRVVVQAAAGGQRVEDSLYVGDVVITRVSLVSATGTSLLSQNWSLTVDGGGPVLVRDVRMAGRNAPSAPVLRYQFGDDQGSVTLELDDAAQVITYEEYHAFGETAVAWGRSQTEVQTKRYRFAGEQRDLLNGLYFIGARVYSPTLCRWITPDPAGASDGLNIYAYVHNNPASATDPSGYGKRNLAAKPLGDGSKKGGGTKKRDGKKKSANWGKLRTAPKDRKELSRKATEDVHYEGMDKAPGGGKPSRSNDHDYPPAALSLIDTKVAHLKFHLIRANFPSDTTAQMIEDIEQRPDYVRTAADLVMLANPNAKLSDEGIDRAHRVANSSMLAITLSVFDRLYEIHHLGSALDAKKLKSATVNFFSAVAGPTVAKDAYAMLEQAAGILIDTKAKLSNAGAVVNMVGNRVADDPHNLRFGDATLNQLILHGFDANYDADGDMTPRSQGMQTAGQKLSPLLHVGLIGAAFTPTTAKVGGAIMSSSLH